MNDRNPRPLGITLAPFDQKVDLERLKSWLRLPHVARWWGDPEPHAASLAARPPSTHALIVAHGTPVGYLCWQRPSREELEAAKLTDLPEGLMDIDIMIGEPDFVGHGIGPRALVLLLAKFRNEGIPFAGLGTSVSNRAAIRAYEKAGFRLFREFQDPDSGLCIYLVADLRPSV